MIMTSFIMNWCYMRETRKWYTCVFDTCTSSWIKLFRMIWNQTTLDNCRVYWTRFFQTLWRSTTQLLELNEQACREFSRDTGSLRLNSKGSATEYMAPVDYHWLNTTQWQQQPWIIYRQVSSTRIGQVLASAWSLIS